MAHGKGFVEERHPCAVCGMTFGLKIQCCRYRCETYFHATCARQVGLEVRESMEGNVATPYVKCYRHVGNEFNIRARLEDLYEIEKTRRKEKPLNFVEAARIMNAALPIVRILGWAWRWAEWWVDYDQSWEPLLEPGQKEKDMTKEELRIVDSTRESRCEDARQCRLIAFGAALRNRLYDEDDDFDREALDRALRAFLNTKSLVGPLDKDEIDFHADWLGRAYRSKSRLLMLGDDKIPVASENGFCFVGEGESRRPKFEIDPSKIPGKAQLDTANIFEPKADGDVDEFLQTTIVEDPPIELRRPSKRKRGSDGVKRGPGRPRLSTDTAPDESQVDSENEPPMKRKPGRPRKNPPEEKDLVSPPQGRGRPPTKVSHPETARRNGESVNKSEASSYFREFSSTRRRRGRSPPKSDSRSVGGEAQPMKQLAQLLSVGSVWKATAKKTQTTSIKKQPLVTPQDVTDALGPANGTDETTPKVAQKHGSHSVSSANKKALSSEVDVPSEKSQLKMDTRPNDPVKPPLGGVPTNEGKLPTTNNPFTEAAKPTKDESGAGDATCSQVVKGDNQSSETAPTTNPAAPRAEKPPSAIKIAKPLSNGQAGDVKTIKPDEDRHPTLNDFDGDDGFGFAELSDDQSSLPGIGKSTETGDPHGAEEPMVSRRRSGARGASKSNDEPKKSETNPGKTRATKSRQRAEVVDGQGATDKEEENRGTVNGGHTSRKQKLQLPARDDNAGAVENQEDESSRPNERPLARKRGRPRRSKVPNAIHQIKDALSANEFSNPTSKRKRVPPQRYTVGAPIRGRNGKSSQAESSDPQTKIRDDDERGRESIEDRSGLNAIEAIKKRRRASTDYLGMDVDQDDLTSESGGKGDDVSFEEISTSTSNDSSEATSAKGESEHASNTKGFADKKKEYSEQRYPSRRRSQRFATNGSHT